MSTFLKEYDVIVVGAGIAGPVAARYLAKAGLNVLIVESAKMPRNKPCSAIQFKYFKRLLGVKPPKQKLDISSAPDIKKSDILVKKRGGLE